MNMNKENNEYLKYMQRISQESMPAYEPFFGEEEKLNLIEVINSGWISEGKFCRECEFFLKNFANREHALITNNGTAALMIGMLALGINKSDDIIVPSLSHAADPNSISTIGANPIFADVEQNTMCMSVRNIEKVITHKTKAILYVCAYGSSDNLQEIEDYAKKNKLLFINDCAPAIGSEFNNRPIASYGDISMLSFFADKTVTMGEGGMLLSNDKKIIDEANIYKHDGRKERGHDLIERKGFNFRITELQAAIGIAQLNRIKETIKQKKVVRDIYKSLLGSSSDIRIFEPEYVSNYNPHRVIVFVKNAKETIIKLNKKGIGARSMFHPMHLQPIYKTDGEFPNTESIFNQGICLPSAPNLSKENIENIVNIIKESL
jgi:perosamine synthetase